MSSPFRPHLLVVDDEACIREALTAALGANYHVHAAASGAEACALLDAHPISGIILDVVLGDEHGLDLVSRFRACSTARILVLTGHSCETVLLRSLREKVDDYLKKPVNLAELQAAIRRLVPQTDSGTDLAERAHRYLDTHLAIPLRVVDLARHLGVSEMHLRRCFYSAHRKTPGRYLAEIRLEAGVRFLTTTALGVNQIAQEVGYRSGTAFGRVFRRVYGVSPSDYRMRSSPPTSEVSG